MMNDEPTGRELMAALVEFRDVVVGKLEQHDGLFKDIGRRFDRLEDRMVRGFDSVDLRFDRLESRIGALERA
jgi:hypothetical protein